MPRGDSISQRRLGLTLFSLILLLIQFRDQVRGRSLDAPSMLQEDYGRSDRPNKVRTMPSDVALLEVLGSMTAMEKAAK
eukprot:5790536-Amphidinium_carterae.1